MEYDRQQYLKIEGDVKLVILDTSDEKGYRVTENRGDGWHTPVWMPEREMQEFETELVGQLSSDQYLRVSEACGAVVQ